MPNYPKSITSLSRKHGFNLSAKYDQAWMFDNSMGPNPLWLTEWLCRDMRLSKGMTVLDMGCGRAISSIFLAREFGCTVFANDLWVAPEKNLKRISEQSLQHRVFPIEAEAHALPYAKGLFDAIICVDAYIYFGTDDLYLGYFSKFVKPGGQIGIVVPGWRKECHGRMPRSLEAFPLGEFASFHSCAWWRRHFQGSGAVEIEKCDSLKDGAKTWLDSARAMLTTKRIKMAHDRTPAKEVRKTLDFWKADVKFIRADKDKQIAIHRIIARKKT